MNAPLSLSIACLAAAACTPVAPARQPPPADGRAEIEAFNRAISDQTRRMDTAASLAMWEDEGVSLLPETEPLVGKRAIAAFLEKVTAGLQGAKMETFEMECSGIEVSGDWASEWCKEHQVVSLPGGKPPFVGWGKILYVLHRGTDGAWRIRREMWNMGLSPEKGGGS